MKLPLQPGQKYGLIALKATTNIDAPLDLGDGYFALPRDALELPAHWQEWVGTIRTRAVHKASLVLVAVGPSERPEILDEGDQRLASRVDALFFGLLLTGRPSFEGEGARISGAHVGGRAEVRNLGGTIRVVRPSGFPWAPIDEEALRRAAHLAHLIEAFQAEPRANRFLLSRTLFTFLQAFTERYMEERIHQFVRAVDGITRAWTNTDFRDRCRTFVEGDTEVCRDLYLIRNATEHFRPWSAELDQQLPPPEDHHRLFRRAHEAEALARYAVARVLERPELWSALADDQVQAFWKKPEEARSAIWGERLHLTVAMRGFSTDLVPELST